MQTRVEPLASLAVRRVVGLMSGTSADGVDAALVDVRGSGPAAGVPAGPTAGEYAEPGGLRVAVLAHLTVPYADDLRAAVLAACEPGGIDAAGLVRLDRRLGEAFADAARAVVTAAGVAPESVHLVGSHGQTVWHAPRGPGGGTLQLGQPAVIAERTGWPVVADFRPRDVAAGGQGAPLVPYVDWCLWGDPRSPRAAQNLGGIANVTAIPAGADPAGVLAFDTGPGNLIIDGLVALLTAGRERFDRDGRLARAGRPSRRLLEEWKADPYFAEPPPKSTGRERFGAAFCRAAWARGQALGLSAADLVATATAFTAETVAEAYARWVVPAVGRPDPVILSGGGVRNPALVEALAAALARAVGPVNLVPSDALGVPAAAKEAVAFAVLASEAVAGRPNVLPSATGARRPAVLGAFWPGGNDFR